MRPLRHLPLLVLVACARPAADGPGPDPVPPALDTLAMRGDTRFLAHDRLGGRDTGSPGATMAGHYIATRCTGLGLAVHEQAVPLEEARVDTAATDLRIGERRFAWGRDLLVAAGTPHALHGFGGVPAWLGSGDDILAAADRLPRLDGRVALTAGPIGREAADILQALGAAGMVHLLGERESFDRYAGSRGRAVTYIANAGVTSSFHPALPGLIAAPGLSRALLDAARDQRPVTVRIAVVPQRIDAFNVACLLPGADQPDAERWIVFTAHYDHLGIGPPDASGDSVYNGFSDNAAGVAMLLAIADAIRRSEAGALGHSVAFLFFTGEERGLLGSDWYVHDPLVPLEAVEAVINLDAGAPPARPWSWRLAGGAGTPLGDLARDVAARHGWAATVSPARANSDYFPFARRGVPAVFIIPGPAPYEGLSADSSQALRARWDRYHQPGDEWYADFPFEGLERYASYALAVARAVDRRGISPGS